MFERARQFTANVKARHAERLNAYYAGKQEFYNQQAEQTAEALRQAGAIQSPTRRTWREWGIRRKLRKAVRKEEFRTPEPNIVATALGGGRRMDRAITQWIPMAVGYVAGLAIEQTMERHHVWPFNK